MRNLAWRRRTLSEANAVIAVSSAIARDLRARAPELARTRLELIPNPVDVQRIRTAAQTVPPADIRRPYAIYIGKLAPNKGSHKLIPAIDAADLTWPIVVVGDGPGRERSGSRREGVGPRRALHRLAGARSRAVLARARLDADLSVARPRVAEPRAARSERARRRDRGDGNRRHGRHHRARSDRPAVVQRRRAEPAHRAPRQQRHAARAARREREAADRSAVRLARGGPARHGALSGPDDGLASGAGGGVRSRTAHA